jgi:hypothetical protein
MPKPKGGRGYKAPYESHQVRVPDPVIPQVHSLIERYQDYIATGGDAVKPPQLLDRNKPVDSFVTKIEDLEQAKVTLQQALKLKANAGGAIKKEIEKALAMLEP